MSTLNVPEAEERARRLLKIYTDGVEQEELCARDFLALAALYREAVEALQRARDLQASYAPVMWSDQIAELDAVLAKAREAGLKEGK